MLVIGLILSIGILSGFILFKRNTIAHYNERYDGNEKVSIIIPARNEEHNLPVILSSIQKQTYQPYEVIVVDDSSEDRTKLIANRFGVKVIENPGLPHGWTGKTWAVWNGYLHSTGEIIVFLDADVQLAPDALESLLIEREKQGGVISVVPYHRTSKFYESLALIPNMLGVFAFTSRFESKNKHKGLYGSCILTTREHYEKVNGHNSIKSELLDDLTLGAKYIEAGLRVDNYIGGKMVSFRMYPEGIKSALEGFAKGAVLSTAKLSVPTTFMIALWIIGILLSESFVFFLHTSWYMPLLIGYFLYMLQIIYFTRSVGNFGFVMIDFHFLSTIFFLVVMVYSLYQVVFLRQVAWKGRKVEVRRSKDI